MAQRCPLPCGASPGRTRRRWLVGAACAMLLGALLTRAACFCGVCRPVRVVGGSMAEAFCGPHYAVACPDCGFHFRCGTEYPPSGQRATCPNCGRAEIPIATATVRPGERVLVDRWPVLRQDLRLWQPVAFRAPADPDLLTVKRLVARGPGRVSIDDGDIYVDSILQQKELAQLREVCVRVYDDRFRAPGTSRWQACDPTSRWQRTADGYRRDDPAPDAGPLDWLEYQQWTCWPQDDPRRPRTNPVEILDHDAYNQSLSRGRLHPVPDLLLSCRMLLSGDARCALRLVSRGATFDWELSAGSTECRLWVNGVLADAGRRPARRAPWFLEFAVCDHRILAALDGVTVFRWNCPPGVTAADSATLPRAAIGAMGIFAQCEGLCIDRDLYYLGPGGAVSWQAPDRLEYAQWFALGDNVPISIDSRFWSALEEGLVVGVVRPWWR